MESPCLIPAERLAELLNGLPRSPGVYLMKDAQGRVLYVGKAGVLRNRVRSYFGSQADLAPTARAMVARIADVDYIVTASEREALLLENNLIKEHRPRHNIKLRDDKQYLYLKIGMQQRYPRVYTARQVAPDGARYFGPYTNAQALRDTIKSLQRLFQFRTCSLDLEKVYKRPCLLYHIKRCTGPCIRTVTEQDYARSIQQLIAFVEGKGERVVDQLQEEMRQAAESLEFERAAALRDRIAAADKAAQRQRVIAVGRGDLDAIGFATEGGEVAVEIFRARADKVVDREEFVLQDAEGAGPREILTQFIQQYYDRATYVPPRILLAAQVEAPEAIESWLSDRRGSRVRLEVPRRGPKKQLLDLVTQNAGEALERMKLKWLADERQTRGAVRELGEALGLPDPPRRIECYDISHIQGTSAVASMVVFEEGRPARHAYRRFRIKAGDQNDDFASMREVIGRRFRRATAADLPPLPPTRDGKGERQAAPAPAGASPTPMARGDRRAGPPDAGRDATISVVEELAADPAAEDAALAAATGEVPDDAGEAGLLAPEEGPAAAAGDKGGWALLPDLVIIDGGKGQLSAALEAMQAAGAPPIPTVGLAKEHEEIFRPGYAEPLLLPRTSQALYLVQRIRDEAHRFAVTYHQQVRKKRMVGSRLDHVTGIGPKRKKALIRRFGSVEGIRRASDEEILAIPGITEAVLTRLREQL